MFNLSRTHGPYYKGNGVTQKWLVIAHYRVNIRSTLRKEKKLKQHTSYNCIRSSIHQTDFRQWEKNEDVLTSGSEANG